MHTHSNIINLVLRTDSLCFFFVVVFVVVIAKITRGCCALSDVCASFVCASIYVCAVYFCAFFTSFNKRLNVENKKLFEWNRIHSIFA